MKLVGVLIVLAAAYAAYHWLFGRGWLADFSLLVYLVHTREPLQAGTNTMKGSKGMAAQDKVATST